MRYGMVAGVSVGRGAESDGARWWRVEGLWWLTGWAKRARAMTRPQALARKEGAMRGTGRGRARRGG
eukprot:6458859-Pyramimonas_sp.AAC.1